MKEKNGLSIFKAICYQILTLIGCFLFSCLANDFPFLSFIILFFFFGLFESFHLSNIKIARDEKKSKYQMNSYNSKGFSLVFRFIIVCVLAFLSFSKNSLIKLSNFYSLSFSCSLYYYLGLIVFEAFLACKKRKYYFLGIFVIFLYTYLVFYVNAKFNFIQYSVLYFNMLLCSIKLGIHLFLNRDDISEKHNLFTYLLLHFVFLFFKVILLVPELEDVITNIIKVDLFSYISPVLNDTFFKIWLILDILINFIAILVSFYGMNMCKKCLHINTLEVVNSKYSSRHERLGSEVKNEKVGSHYEYDRVLVEGEDPNVGYFNYYDTRKVKVDDYKMVTHNYRYTNYNETCLLKCKRCKHEYSKIIYHGYKTEIK